MSSLVSRRELSNALSHADRDISRAYHRETTGDEATVSANSALNAAGLLAAPNRFYIKNLIGEFDPKAEAKR